MAVDGDETAADICSRQGCQRFEEGEEWQSYRSKV